MRLYPKSFICQAKQSLLVQTNLIMYSYCMGSALDPELKKELEKESLRYGSDDKPGFFRQKISGKFKYYDLDGKKINDKKVIERIESLGIPPAWKHVWISPKTNTHLQATGIDDKKRKQYIYHPDWIKISQQNKFSKMVDFGLNLPKIRSRVKYDLGRDDLDKRKIIATVVWLLEHTFIRIGNENYSKENDSYGLTTLRNRHVTVRGDEIKFDFVGKSGVPNELSVSNPTVAKIIKKCIELPGYEIFKFIDEKGDRKVVDSQDINEFLKEITNDDFSAKDFRTWGATDLSANIFYKLGNAPDKKILKTNIKDTVKKVSEHLNNTISVCRSYYIHPTVIETYTKEILVPHFGKHSGKKSSKGLSWDELALIKLLEKYPPIV